MGACAGLLFLEADRSPASSKSSKKDEADINQPSIQLTTSELPPQAPIIIEEDFELSLADELLEEEAPPLSPADKTLPQDHDYVEYVDFVGLVIEVEPGLKPQNEDVLDQQPGPANEVEHRPSEILPGTRDGSTIYHDGHGFYYHCNKTSNKKRMLRCIKTRSNGCPARASMGLGENSPILQTRNSPSHNHDPDFSKMRQARLLKRLKERSREERSVPVAAIFSEEVLRDPEAATSLSRSNVTRCMTREKKKTQLSDFVTLEDIVHMTI